MAHAIHPNYPQFHQTEHAPELQKGVVLKVSAGQKYTTDSSSTAIIRLICNEAQVPLQEFIVRNDSPSGSTIGPMISTNTGIMTIDVGAP